jgi:hypothetical protein
MRVEEAGGGANPHIDLNNIPHPRPLPMNPRHAWVPECKRRRIVLKDLVQEVVISPWAEADNVEEIKFWNSLKGFTARRDSALRNCKMPKLEEYRKHWGLRSRHGCRSELPRNTSFGTFMRN